MTSVEAGHLLGVSTATAHKALKVLADRRIVVRKSKSGTFVGPNAGSLEEVGTQIVFIFATEEKREHTYSQLVPMFHGLDRMMPAAKALLHFVPHIRAEEYLRKMLVATNSYGKVVGAVAMSCPVNVYRFLAEAGVPTIVSGSLSVERN